MKVIKENIIKNHAFCIHRLRKALREARGEFHHHGLVIEWDDGDFSFSVGDSFGYERKYRLYPPLHFSGS